MLTVAGAAEDVRRFRGEPYRSGIANQAAPSLSSACNGVRYIMQFFPLIISHIGLAGFDAVASSFHRLVYAG